MSELKKKSENNLIASEFLIKQGLHASSVHCAYYSCLQLLKYSINFFFEVAYDELENNINYSKGSSHKYIINYVFNELKSAKYDNYETQHRNIKDLKEWRETSDYENTPIGSVESDRAYKTAKEFTTYIKENLK